MLGSSMVSTPHKQLVVLKDEVVVLKDKVTLSHLALDHAGSSNGDSYADGAAVQ